MKFTYLLIDFFTLIFPLLFSFHPKLNFFKTWNALFPSIFFSAIPFVAFDIYFTHLKVWGFNPQYISGYFIANLPVEEIAFFFCIPYACLFTYHCLKQLLPIRSTIENSQVVSAFFLAGSLLITFLFRQELYTVFTFISLLFLLIVAQYICRVNWLRRFYLTYLLLLLPFFIVNGLLTGTGPDQPVVWYNNLQIAGPRLLTIPVEDIFYGMDLILLNLLFYHYFQEIYVRLGQNTRP
ncbi:lycopene cyclase domain-containing protein [Mucilaginibacter flavus]|uniref:lycopene cyclase domain-containing protein n=1 Tax=Mucilaginibacter flavus TaxID=931504 RepID=UPI0025B45196|nr:lycopene cyclase domain-containing protein [Mucilaginibacter flavus]MDN3584578.1 lycopene cyclase domain-containing protein [Mucilaginibacter flavus]